MWCVDIKAIKHVTEIPSVVPDSSNAFSFGSYSYYFSADKCCTSKLDTKGLQRQQKIITGSVPNLMSCFVLYYCLHRFKNALH